jgi:putative membrane protein
VAFVEEGVSATRERNGVLLYVSAMEDACEILPDLGIDGRVPRAEWHRLRRLFTTAPRAKRGQALLDVIRGSGDVLAPAFVPGADNPNEIPDRPRLR